MKSRLSLSNSRIIDYLHIHYNIDVDTLTCLPFGADMNSAVYKALVADKSAYFIKVKCGHGHDIAIDIMELLHNAGIKQIIPIIKTIHGQTSQVIDNFTLIVYPFIDGKNGFNQNLTDEQWLVLGKTLKQVHGVEVREDIRKQLRHESYTDKWRDRVRSFYAIFETRPTDDDIAIKLWEYINKHIQIIRKLVDRAEQLAHAIQKEASPKFVLCHSDLHGGNVLIDKNNNLYLVDWDAPMMAPKERDLMFIGAGICNVWNKPNEEKQFYKGYDDKTQVDMMILTYYRYERIVEDIALFCQDIFVKKIRDEDRSELYKHFIAMFEPNGVIDMGSVI
ncbi:MAG: phosphotransferase [Gammaproteobacteria bacterium]